MFRFHLIIFYCLLSVLTFGAEGSVTREEYIHLWKDEAIYQMVVHKIPASITLAQGILESGDGNSRLAKEGNNHFGIKCHNDWTGRRIFEDDETRGECFRQYATAHESYEDHSIFLQRKRYEALFQLESDDYKGWAKGLKECGYATNPKYPQLLIGIIEEFHLHEYDKIGKEFLRKNKIPDRGKYVDTPAAVITEPVQEKSKSKKPKHTGNDSERSSITISNGRQVLQSGNHIKYTIAKAGDTPESIARDFDLHEVFIRKFNDLNAGDKIKSGEFIYIQPKRNQGSQESCVVQSGESLRDLSQRYGIKMKKIRRYNQLEPGSEPAAGSTIKLKR